VSSPFGPLKEAASRDTQDLFLLILRGGAITAFILAVQRLVAVHFRR
jgi:hypothetical protein